MKYLNQALKPADHRAKVKDSKNLKEYLDLARELEKLFITKVTVRALGTIKTTEKR